MMKTFEDALGELIETYKSAGADAGTILDGIEVHRQALLDEEMAAEAKGREAKQ